MIPPELIDTGIQIVGGLIDIATNLFSKIGEKKRSQEKAIREEAEAVYNINKAYTDAYVAEFNRLTTGSSKQAYDYIKSLWDFIRDYPPIGFVDPVTGKRVPAMAYNFIVTPETGTISLVQGQAGQNQTIIKSKQFPKNLAIFSAPASLIPQPQRAAQIVAWETINKDLYDRAYQYNVGKSGLTMAEIQQWKDGGTVAENPPTTTTTAANASNVKSKIDTKYIVIGGIALLAILGAAYYFTKSKKSKVKP